MKTKIKRTITGNGKRLLIPETFKIEDLLQVPVINIHASKDKLEAINEAKDLLALSIDRLEIIVNEIEDGTSASREIAKRLVPLKSFSISSLLGKLPSDLLGERERIEILGSRIKQLLFDL